MATNRDKINKMNNEEFAEKFSIKGQCCEACGTKDKIADKPAIKIYIPKNKKIELKGQIKIEELKQCIQ